MSWSEGQSDGLRVKGLKLADPSRLDWSTFLSVLTDAENEMLVGRGVVHFLYLQTAAVQ